MGDILTKFMNCIQKRFHEVHCADPVKTDCIQLDYKHFIFMDVKYQKKLMPFLARQGLRTDGILVCGESTIGTESIQNLNKLETTQTETGGTRPTTPNEFLFTIKCLGT
jgi:hypothetical protein